MPTKKQNSKKKIAAQLMLLSLGQEGTKAKDLQNLAQQIQSQGMDFDSMLEITPSKRIEKEHELICMSADKAEIEKHLDTIQKVAIKNCSDLNTVRTAYSALYSLAILNQGVKPSDIVDVIHNIAETAAKIEGAGAMAVIKGIITLQSIAVVTKEPLVTTKVVNDILELGKPVENSAVSILDNLLTSGVHEDNAESDILQISNTALRNTCDKSVVFHALRCLVHIAKHKINANIPMILSCIAQLPASDKELANEIMWMTKDIAENTDDTEAKVMAVSTLTSLMTDVPEIKDQCETIIEALQKDMPEEKPKKEDADDNQEPTAAERISKIFDSAISSPNQPDSQCYKILRIFNDNKDDVDISILAVTKLGKIATMHDKADAKMIMKYIGMIALDANDKKLINEALQTIEKIARKKSQMATIAINLAYLIGDKKPECKDSALSILKSIKIYNPSTIADANKAIKLLKNDAPE